MLSYMTYTRQIKVCRVPLKVCRGLHGNEAIIPGPQLIISKSNIISHVMVLALVGEIVACVSCMVKSDVQSCDGHSRIHCFCRYCIISAKNRNSLTTSCFSSNS